MDELSEKPDHEDLEIHTEIVTGRCRLENMILHSGSISGLVSDGHYLSGIPYCEIQNLTADTRTIINGIVISMDFDLVLLYEYHNFEKTAGLYNIYTEKIRKTLVVDKADFSDFHCLSNNGRCLCLVKNIKHEMDYDFNKSSLKVTIFADIECLILEAGTVEVIDSGICRIVAADHDTIGVVFFEKQLSQYIKGISLYFDEITETLHKLDQRVNNCEIRLNKLPDESK